MSAEWKRAIALNDHRGRLTGKRGTSFRGLGRAAPTLRGCTPFVVDGAVVLADRLVQLHAAPFARGEFRGAQVPEHAGFAALARRDYHPVAYLQVSPLRYRRRQASRGCVCVQRGQHDQYDDSTREAESMRSYSLRAPDYLSFSLCVPRDDEATLLLGPFLLHAVV